MKKYLKILLAIAAAFIIFCVVSFTFHICPPKGPWPQPPWCEQTYAPRHYTTDNPTSHLSQIISTNMDDTWGRNYNFMMFETTWDNIVPSFDRLQQDGSKEVFVHDFHWARYNGDADFKSTDYRIDGDVFINDQRDEEISQEHLNTLAAEAHKHGMKIGYKSNIAFVNIGKYLLNPGKISENVKKDFDDFNSAHSDEWIEDFFSKWKARLILKAEQLNAAGFDYLSVTPNWMAPTFAGKEELVNRLQTDLITAVKGAFNGKVHVSVDRYGFIDGKNGDEDWGKYDYYKSADIVEYPIYNLIRHQTAENPSREEMRKAFSLYFDDLDAAAKEKGVRLTLMPVLFSVRNGVNHGIVEYLDILNTEIKSMPADLEHQAETYQAFFEALADKERPNIERINVAGFWWDDALHPDIMLRNDLGPSIRNKPAEAVVRKWALS